MWESLNSAWLEFSATSSRRASPPSELPRCSTGSSERSALFRGALLNTILRNDTFYFSQLGTFLERADNTARILDVKYYVLLPQNEMVGGEIDNVQWARDPALGLGAPQLPLGLQATATGPGASPTI